MSLSLSSLDVNQSPSHYPACMKDNTRTASEQKLLLFKFFYIYRKFAILQDRPLKKPFYEEPSVKPTQRQKVIERKTATNIHFTYSYTAEISLTWPRKKIIPIKVLQYFFLPMQKSWNRTVHFYVPLYRPHRSFQKLEFMTKFDLLDNKSNSAIIECISSL